MANYFKTAFGCALAALALLPLPGEAAQLSFDRTSLMLDGRRTFLYYCLFPFVQESPSPSFFRDALFSCDLMRASPCRR